MIGSGKRLNDTVNDWISNGHTIFGSESDNSVTVSRNCRGLQSERGLKIHQAKLNAKERW